MRSISRSVVTLVATLAIAPGSYAQPAPADVPPPAIPALPNSGNIPSPPVGPGPSTAGPFSIQLDLPGAPDAAKVFAEYKPGSRVALGAKFVDTATGAAMNGLACLPEWDLADQFAPNGRPHAKFVGNGCQISDDGTRARGNCQLEFVGEGRFSVHVHCAGLPQISSAGDDGDFNFLTSQSVFAHEGPNLRAANPAPRPAKPKGDVAPSAASPSHAGSGSHTVLIAASAAAAGLGLLGVIVAAQGPSNGTPMYCFSTTSTIPDCPSFPMHCEPTQSMCEDDLNSYEALCHGSSGTFTVAPGACQQSSRAAARQSGLNVAARSRRSAPPVAHVTPTRSSPSATSLETVAALAAIATTTYAIWRLARPHKHIDAFPWIGPGGGGVMLGGAF